MNTVLDEWNNADEAAATNEMLACCGATRWAAQMVAVRPIQSIPALSEIADRVWSTMQEPDWMEAFACHPRIGEHKAADASGKSNAWSAQEQAGTSSAAYSVLRELAEGNAQYVQRFGFTYIACATGKTADELLSILKRRLGNDRVAELKEAVEQQRQIMQLRLGKWLIS